MKGNDIFVLALLIALGTSAFADTSVKIEEEADKAAGMNRMPQARALYVKAGEQRLKEAALYEKKSDELSFEATDDDDDLPSPGSGDKGVSDQAARNFIAAARDFEKGAKPKRCNECVRKAEAVKDVSKKVRDELGALKAWIEKGRDATEIDPKPYVAKDPLAALKAAREALENGKSAAPKKQAELWSKVGYEGFRAFKPEVAKEARDAIAALKQKPGCYAGQWLNAIEAYDALKAFPRAEADTATPKDLAALGVKDKLTVVAGELDWDADDATKCVQEALDTPGVTTVVLEDRGSPWYVKTIRMRSNQRLLLKKGVKVLMDRVSGQLKDKSPMIEVKGVKNVIVEGEGDNYVGKFASLAERKKNSNDYGGSGLSVESSENVVVRNITFGANTMDGVVLSGMGGDAKNVWLENLVLRDNYRQAMSVCNAFGLYCRKVAFVDTIGGDPMCGIDFEPTYETEANSECYFYDCEFGGNAGAAVNFSSSSYYPVTAHFKRCHFGAIPNCYQVIVFARCGVYMGANVPAPSNILFEDCDMECHADSYPFKIDNSSLFNVTIRNVKAKVVDKDGKSGSNSPITVNLAREYRRFANWSEYSPENNGAIVVDGFEAEGYREPFVEFRDRTGGYSVKKISGRAKLNGKEVDVGAFSYEAPEKDVKEIAKFNPADYLPPAADAKAVTPAELPAGFDFSWNGAWYEAPPEYRAIYAEGGQWKMMKVQPGLRELDLEGRPVAYYIRSTESLLKTAQRDKKPFTLYFEVPTGQDCLMKVVWGTGELKNAKGETVRTFDWPGCITSQYFTCKTAGDKAEVWSITATSGMTLKFFAPFSGIVAESPECLPRRK